MTLPTNIQVEPTGRNPLILALKLVLLVAVVSVAVEVSWRFTGVQPAPSDLLTFDRLYRAAQNSPDAVALIGSSRVICDLDPRVLKRELSQWDFYQLALNGTSALAMLEDLARDRAFHGHVLCEFNISHVMEEYPFGQNPYLQFIQRKLYVNFLNTWTMETLGEHSDLVAAKDWDFFRSLGGRLGLFTVLAEPPPREDRFTELHRRGKDNQHAIARWIQMTPSRAKGASGFEHITSWVDEIRQRGGDVVFVRLPVSGSLRRMENATYPDRDDAIRSLAARGITVIDFAREPSLSGFDCPDESHLDADDAARFSTALARILADRKLLAQPTSHPFAAEGTNRLP